MRLLILFYSFHCLLLSTLSAFTCTVNQGSDETISGDINCGTITVSGILRVLSNTNIVANRIEVTTTGTLYVGTSTSPVSNVRIYLNHAYSANVPNPTEGQLMSYGSTYMYGITKTFWTLLKQDCNKCTLIKVEQCNNWNIGDRLVIAPTGNGATSWGAVIQSPNNFKAEERIITGININTCEITLNSATLYYHRGEWIDGQIPTQAEILNMDRSILITGPDPYYYNNGDHIYGFQGITTRKSGSVGVMQIYGTKIEKCGRVHLGEYCLHFHYAGNCKECKFVGNVIEYGNNKGITVHGTHYSTVDNNVIYNIRGAYVYIEDGNEYENVLSNNVALCPELNTYSGLGGIPASTVCMLKGVKNQEDSDNHEQTGIYINTGSNHMIGNHVINMENALFLNAVFNWGNPDGNANMRVCKLSMPFGVTKGNVFHNNAGFGWYANSLYATKVLTDENGKVADWKTCNLWNIDTGVDQSQNVIVEDHVEYFEDFSIGVYECGDITFKNTISAFTNKGIYWKSYRRGANSGPFCQNCTFYGNDVQILGPGGTGVMEFVDSKFISKSGHNQLNINHHCGLTGAHGVTGGLCATHYVFNNVNFGGIEPTFYSETYDGVSSNNPTSLTQTDGLMFYNNYIYYVTNQAHPTFNSNQCTITGQWTKCPDSMGIRIVRIYSPNRGSLTITSTDGSYSIPYRNLQRFMGYNTYDTNTCSGSNGIYGPQDGSTCKHRVWPSGYTFIVKQNDNININVPQYNGVMYDTFTMEYSDIQMSTTSISVTISGDNRLSLSTPCVISSKHSRQYITQYGPYIPQTGAWWICKGGNIGIDGAWTTTSNKNDFKSQIVPLNWQVSGSTTTSIKAVNGLSGNNPSPTPQPVTNPTPKPVESPSGGCGNVPTTCQSNIDWAVNTGSKNNPEWYPNFYETTDVQLSSTTQDDMIFYWVCTNVNPNGECTGLTLPCSRPSCSGTTTTQEPCGYIPNTCDGDLTWAVNTGSQQNPEYYPNFYKVTGVELSSTTSDDMVYYWFCTNTNPNGNCDGLQKPCSKPSCSSSSSSGTTTTTTTTTTTKRPCGYIPTTCEGDINWATNIGSKGNPEWYPNFQKITNVPLSSATTTDMIQYWVCTNANPNGNCDGLQIPCSKPDCDDVGTQPPPETFVDNVGLGLSVGLQSNPLSSTKQAEILNDLSIYRYRLYFNDFTQAQAILAKKPNAKFSLEISAWDFSNNGGIITESIVLSLLNKFDSISNNIEYIFLGNEPLHAGSGKVTYYNLYNGLITVINVIKKNIKWNHLQVSIPFSSSAVIDSYPVDNGKFREPLSGAASTNNCGNCVNSMSLGSNSYMFKILNIYKQYNMPFSIQIYPYFTCAYNNEISINYCLGLSTGNGGDGVIYNGMIEAQYIATKYAIQQLIGSNNINIMITETGWPTYSSSISIANINNAEIYIKQTLSFIKLSTSVLYKKNIFFFETFDEDKKGPVGNHENHFGWFDKYGNSKFNSKTLGVSAFISNDNTNKVIVSPFDFKNYTTGNYVILAAFIVAVAVIIFLIVYCCIKRKNKIKQQIKEQQDITAMNHGQTAGNVIAAEDSDDDLGI